MLSLTLEATDHADLVVEQVKEEEVKEEGVKAALEEQAEGRRE